MKTTAGAPARLADHLAEARRAPARLSRQAWLWSAYWRLYPLWDALRQVVPEIQLLARCAVLSGRAGGHGAAVIRVCGVAAWMRARYDLSASQVPAPRASSHDAKAMSSAGACLEPR